MTPAAGMLRTHASKLFRKCGDVPSCVHLQHHCTPLGASARARAGSRAGNRSNGVQHGTRGRRVRQNGRDLPKQHNAQRQHTRARQMQSRAAASTIQNDERDGRIDDANLQVQKIDPVGDALRVNVRHLRHGGAAWHRKTQVP